MYRIFMKMWMRANVAVINEERRLRLSRIILMTLISVSIFHESPAFAGKECSPTAVEIAPPAQSASDLSPKLANVPISKGDDKDSRPLPDVPVIKSSATQENAARPPYAATRYGAAKIPLVRRSNGNAAKAITSDGPRIDGVPITISTSPTVSDCN
jgi:hypothetical protein